MSFTIWLLISHKDATIPGQWSFFMAPAQTEAGMLISNRIFTTGYYLNPNATPQTFSTISLGISLGELARHEGRIRQIAAAVKIPQRPAGAIVGTPDCEAWAFEFVQGLIDNQYLVSLAMAKMRAARDLRIDGPPINA